MRLAGLSLFLIAGASASVLPRQTVNGAPLANNSATGPSVNNGIPVFNTHSWPLLQPQQALAALHAKAAQNASAVLLLPGVAPPNVGSKTTQSISHGLNSDRPSTKVDHHAVTEQWLEENRPRPQQLRPLAHQMPKLASSKEATRIHETAASTSSCPSIETHVEWDNASPQQQLAYVTAMECLKQTPARSGLPGVQNRWDDLVALHQNKAAIIHNVGQFLPWHRYFLKIFEMELRNTCQYAGPMIWWDEVKDAGRFAESSLGTSQYFGAFPVATSPQCITNGIFANDEEHIGPGKANTNHCLARNINEGLTSRITQSFVNTCNSYNDFEDMNNCVFFGPHAYTHDAFGGVMSDVDTSPGDPIFFMHHSYIDHNWRIWENVDPLNRVYAIGGFTTQKCGNNCQPTELNYVLDSFNFYPSVTVEQVMNTEGPYLCYRYDY